MPTPPIKENEKGKATGGGKAPEPKGGSPTKPGRGLGGKGTESQATNQRAS